MNKKGFTLVELLAVIAILAILVIIALPNVLQMYNDAKVGAFVSEAQSIYKTATAKYLADVTTGTSKNTYTQADNLTTGGESGLKFCIKLGSNGTVENFQITNGTYHFPKSGATINYGQITDIKKENIDSGDLTPSCS